jgi:hypothetical protein
VHVSDKDFKEALTLLKKISSQLDLLLFSKPAAQNKKAIGYRKEKEKVALRREALVMAKTLGPNFLNFLDLT